MTTKQLIKLSRKMQRIEARICAKLKLEKTINSCEHYLHLQTAVKMYENFKKAFEVSYDLENLLSIKEMQFSN